MKWKNIKKAGLTTKEIAKRLKYSNANSFRNSSKYKIIMDLLDEVIGIRYEHPGSFAASELVLETESLRIKERNAAKRLRAFANIE